MSLMNESITNKFRDISFHLPEWDVLLKISDEYSKKPIPGSNSLFSDDIWYTFDEFGEPFNFYFATTCISENLTLIDVEYVYILLFFKVRTFHLFEEDSNKGQPYSISTVHSMFSCARKSLVPFMYRNGIFIVDSITNRYSSLSIFTPSLLELLIQEVQNDNTKNSSKTSTLVAISRYLSRDVNVPAPFRPNFDFFKYSRPSSVFGFDTRDIKGYQPIPDDDYFWIGRSSLDFVHFYAEDIIRLHELTVSVWKTDPPDSIKADYCSALSRGATATHALKTYVTDWRLKELVRRMKITGVKLPCFTLEHQRMWNIEQVNIDSHSLMNQKLTSGYLYYIFQLLFGALCCVILIPTGMRVSELRRVDVKRLSENPNQDGIYSYVNAITKVKPSGTFFSQNEIPIPVETWRAIQYLDRLTRPLREENNTSICVLPLNLAYAITCQETDQFGTIIKVKSCRTNSRAVNNAIGAFCRFIGSSTIPTTHRFRKSIAEFMLCKTKKAPILICQLFGHRSIAMTLKYLKRSSLIRREVKEYAIV